MAISVNHASSRALPGLCIALLALGLSACVSTQQKARWLHIEDARIIAAQSPTVVRSENPSVRVGRVSILRRGPQAVFVVRVQNLADHPLFDLPISVGLLRHGKRQYLNRASDLAYSEAHLAAVGARREVTWVFSTGLKDSSPARAFALVGSHSAAGVDLGRRAPDLRVTVAQAATGRLQLRVSNRSSVPQPQLPVYAVAGSHGRITAAGLATIANLAAGQTARVQLGLIGRGTPNLQLEALPTLFLP